MLSSKAINLLQKESINMFIVSKEYQHNGFSFNH